MADTARSSRKPITRRNPMGKTKKVTFAPDPTACPQQLPDQCGAVETNKDLLSGRDREILDYVNQRIIDELPQLEIAEMGIYVYTTEQLRREGKLIDNPDLDPKTINGVNDRKLGTTDRALACQTCNKGICDGHLGYVELAAPLYHPMFLKSVAHILTCLCPSCGQLLITQQEAESAGLLKYTGRQRLKHMAEYCSKTVRCVRGAKCQDLPRIYKGQEKDDIITYTELGEKSKSGTVLTPNDALTILKALDNHEDQIKLLGFSPLSPPSALIMELFPVIPPIARPPADIGGMILNDNLTKVYAPIVRVNNQIAEKMRKRESNITNELTSTLKFLIRHIMQNSDGRMKQPAVLECFTKRIKGKGGHIRSNMMGKRKNLTLRTVANPEPSLEFGEILIPRELAKTLTYPEKVNQINRAALQKLFSEGKVVRFTIGSGEHNGVSFKVNEYKRRNYKLRIGDTVHRWLQNGDYVVVNRQPTLHRFGMVGARVRLSDKLDTLVIGLHLSITTALNADFDGDELNVHVPQTLDEISEVAHLTNMTECIMHEGTNKSVAALVFNNLLLMPLLTDEGMMLEPSEFYDLIFEAFPDHSFPIEEHKARMARFNIPLYSGRSAFSALLPNNFNYRKGNVRIINGVLVQGVLTKDHVGNTHNSIIQALIQFSGSQKAAAEFITRASHMMDRFSQEYPVSIGLGDCYPKNRDEHQSQRNSAITRMKRAAIALGSTKTTDPSEEQRREAEMVAHITVPQDQMAKKAMDNLDPRNTFILALLSGAKGSRFNITQIMSMLGQQFIYGKRPSTPLPYFLKDDKDPEARGFVSGSFARGLNPAEFMYHIMAARIGILDTATRVSDTGALQRRLIKFLESVRYEADGTVVNAGGQIIQFLYGEDGFSAAEMVKQPSTVGTVVSFIDLTNVTDGINNSHGYL